MRILTIEQMKERKRLLGYSNEQLSILSGVPESTIQKIFSGTTAAPRRQTLEKLSLILAPDEGQAYDFSGSNAGKVAEPTIFDYLPRRKQGEFTVADLDLLPEDQRAELIDGVIYDMGAPTTIHQVIQLELATQLRQYIRTNKGTCIPMIAPTDVQINCDEFSMLQPDVFVVCNRDIFTKKNVFGVPDLVIEILSPSTRNKDTDIKLRKYRESGVREYWIVDPDKEKIIVHNFSDPEEAHIPRIYTFEDKIPVFIWDGNCLIDFAEIKEAFQFITD